MAGHARLSPIGHTVHAVHCHFVFCTKYRKPVLRGEVGQAVRKQIQEICRGHDLEILQGHVRPDHVHLLLSIPPHLSPSRVMQAVKGKTSHRLLAISEFPKGRKYLISLSFRGKSSIRPAQVGRFDVNIVIHGSTAVRGRGDLVAYGWALWKLPAPWTHRTRPPHLGKRCAFSTSFHRAFPIKSSTKNPERPQNSVGKPG